MITGIHGPLIPTPTEQRSGEMASGVVNRILRNTQACAVKDAVAKARAQACCPTSLYPGFAGGVTESLRITQETCPAITSEEAQTIASKTLRGVPSSVLTARREYATVQAFLSPTDPTKRFVEYQGNFIPPVCPGPTAEQLNSTLPRPSQSCLATVPAYMRPSL